MLRSLDAVDECAAAFECSGKRRILGIAGPPGAGKTTLARAIVARAPDRRVLVPMDGFHLAGNELARLGRADRKGAEDTFDAAGYIALLARLRAADSSEIVYAPEFRREFEEPIAGAIAVTAGHSLVVTEGNYLLLERKPWNAVRTFLDEVWYVDLDPAVRIARLVARHVRFGRTEATAREWVERSDEANAAQIATTRARADRIVTLAEEAPWAPDRDTR